MTLYEYKPNRMIWSTVFIFATLVSIEIAFYSDSRVRILILIYFCFYLILYLSIIFGLSNRKIEYNNNEIIYKYEFGRKIIRLEDINHFEIINTMNPNGEGGVSIVGGIKQFYTFNLNSGKKEYIPRVLTSENEEKLLSVINKR